MKTTVDSAMHSRSSSTLSASVLKMAAERHIDRCHLQRKGQRHCRQQQRVAEEADLEQGFCFRTDCHTWPICDRHSTVNTMVCQCAVPL